MTHREEQEVFHFIRQQKSLPKWSDAEVMDLIRFYFQHNQAGIVRQRDGRVIGVGFARVVNRRKPAHIKDTWYHNRYGNALYVVHITALHPAAVAALWRIMVRLFGRRRWFMGTRHGKVRTWDFTKYEQRVMGILNKPPQPVSTVETLNT